MGDHFEVPLKYRLNETMSAINLWELLGISLESFRNFFGHG